MLTLTVLMNVQKPNTSDFKDAMNTSYIPAVTSQGEPNNSKNFVEEFERVAVDTRVNINNEKKGENNPNPLNNKKEPENNKTYTEGDRNTSKKTDRENPRGPDDKVEERGPRENKNDKNPQENEKTDNNKNKQEKIKNSQEQPNENENKSGDRQVKGQGDQDNRTIREVIKMNQLQRLEMIKIKEDIKDNFGESKKISSSDQLEKVMLKEPEANPGVENKEITGIKNKLINNTNNNQVDKTADMKAGEEKIREESTGEKKQSQEPEVKKKDDNPIVTNDVKLQKNDSGQEKQPNMNLLNDFSKNFRQVSDLKVERTFTQSNLFDQYQVFREKIASSVENSIKLLLSSGESRATIQLHPPELGRLQVELIVHENQVTAKINTENIAVKEVILGNLNQLKSNLENAGTQINKFEVEVGGFKNQFEQHFSRGESGSGSRRGNGGDYLLSQESDELKPGEIRNYAALTAYLGRSINCLI